MKTCIDCGKHKQLPEFHIRSDSGNPRPFCKSCASVRRHANYDDNKEHCANVSKEYYANNKKHYKEVRAQHYIDNKDVTLTRNAKWKVENKEQHAKKCAEYARANRGKRNAWDAEYAASKIKRTPPWFEKELVEEIYEEADTFRKIGLAVDVDHIVPLRGKMVSGLHCIANLQILEEGVNRSKSNNFVV